MDTLLQVFEDTKRKHGHYKKDFEKIQQELIKLKEKIDFDNNLKISVFYYEDYTTFKKCFSKKILMSNNLINTRAITNHYGFVISKLGDEKYIFVCKGIKEMYKVCYIIEEKYKYVKEYKIASMPMTLKDFAKHYETDFESLNSLTNETIVQGDYKFTKFVDLIKRITY